MPTTETGVNVAPLGLVIALLVVAAACGGSSRPEMSPEAERGRRIANTSGCGSCHGADGEGGVGPQLAGLYGSTVTLSDGTTVVADDAYIRRSITDPDADRVEGYTLKMPAVALERGRDRGAVGVHPRAGIDPVKLGRELGAVNLRRASLCRVHSRSRRVGVTADGSSSATRWSRHLRSTRSHCPT